MRGVCMVLSVYCRYDEVHVFLHDISAQQWVKGLPPEITARISIHDGVQDLMQDGVSDLPPFPDATTLCKRAVVVDSLSFLLLRHSPATMCRWLMSSSSNTHTLCLLHANLHEKKVLSQMDYVATSRLVLTTPLEATMYTGNIYTTHRRPSGKILRQVEQYCLSADCVSLTTSDCAVSKLSEALPQVDPAANLTFDLHLSAQEKEERSQVVLPYTSVQEEHRLVGVSAHKGSGKIFYEPDEGDCFGDSDPDDDLDL